MVERGAVRIREIGRVKEIKTSIAKVEGLSTCLVGQIINCGHGVKGFVIGFNEDEVLVLLLSPGEIKAGDKVYSESESFKMPVGNNFLGRIVDFSGEPLDGKGVIDEDNFARVFAPAPSVLDRVPIEDMLYTGIRTLDAAIPIGKGQRQLIIGDRMTGKTSIAVDIILNQKDKDVICIYCCIGRDYASFEKVVSILKEKGVLDNMVIVSGIASSSVGEQYLAPYGAVTLGEYFMCSGRDVVIVFDDLTKHAWAYRELSLLLERPPGREAYPGDIFYLHAQLMERAAKLSPSMGGGSMTLFPIADTLQGDIADFIPTNLISMTDGQIFLNSDLFGEGFKPAIDLGLSVSRIGSKVQSSIFKEFVKDLGLGYIQYRETIKATRLRAGISEDLNKRLRHGEKIERIFMQEKNKPSPIEEQLLLFYALQKGALDIITNEQCYYFKSNILEFAKKKHPGLVSALKKNKELTPEERDSLKGCVVEFFEKQ